MNNKLIVMARPPLAGQVKTRIASVLGDDVALEVYKRLLQHTMSVVQNSGFKTDVFVTDNHNFFHDWGFNQIVQSGNDLGERMHYAFKTSFSDDPGAVVMIGTDCAEIGAEHISMAFDLLRRVDVVFGPAFDGGYYLIGMKLLHDGLFSQMPWSAPDLLEKSIARVRSLNLSFATITPLSDVDMPNDIPEAWGLNTIIAKS